MQADALACRHSESAQVSDPVRAVASSPSTPEPAT
jgi:hypothetical protein